MSTPEVLAAAVLHKLDEWRSGHGKTLFTLGICGSQGSGKTTLVCDLAARLEARGLRVATLSLDDLYLTRDERLARARAVHPLFATRGVPGTHDVALGLATIAALHRGEPVSLPRFDKASDDRLPQAQWPRAPEEAEVLLLEGWCLGARAQDDLALAAPVNPLERDEDPQGIWRRAANADLAGEYQDLFRLIDRLILLAAPDWNVVAHWREQQEAELRKRGGSATMSPAQVTWFVHYYERITRHILATMPAYADLTVRLGPDREPLELMPRSPDQGR